MLNIPIFISYFYNISGWDGTIGYTTKLFSKPLPLKLCFLYIDSISLNPTTFRCIWNQTISNFARSTFWISCNSNTLFRNSGSLYVLYFIWNIQESNAATLLVIYNCIRWKVNSIVSKSIRLGTYIFQNSYTSSQRKQWPITSVWKQYEYAGKFLIIISNSFYCSIWLREICINRYDVKCDFICSMKIQRLYLFSPRLRSILPRGLVLFKIPLLDSSFTQRPLDLCLWYIFSLLNILEMLQKNDISKSWERLVYL